MIRLKILYLFLLSYVGVAHAQTVEDVLNGLLKQYSLEQPLQFNTEYKLYKTFDSNVIHQSYNGSFYKNNEQDVYMKINDTEILSNKEVTLKINHSEKAVLLTNPELNLAQEYDFSALLKLYKTGRFEDKSSHWEIELLPKQMNLPYAKIILQISKDYLLKKQMFFYANAIDFSEDFTEKDFNQPRLEVIYTNYNRELSKEIKFNTSSFLEFKNNKPIVSSSLKGYELLDRRI